MVASKKSSSHRVKGKQVTGQGTTSAKPHAPAQPNAAATIDRRENRDRRSAADRRTHALPVAVEHRGLERRAKVNRRRQIDPTTCERDYTSDEIEFMAAIDEYKRRNGRMFPTCSEVLEVIKSLGYEKRPKTAAAALPTIDLPVATSPVVVG
jgi:hypothetical protein